VFYVTGVFALGALATIVFGVDRFARAEARAESPTDMMPADEEGESMVAVDIEALTVAVDAPEESPLAEAALSA